MRVNSNEPITQRLHHENTNVGQLWSWQIMHADAICGEEVCFELLQHNRSGLCENADIQKIKVASIEDFVVKMQIVLTMVCSGTQQDRTGSRTSPAATSEVQMASSSCSTSPTKPPLRECRGGSTKLRSTLTPPLKSCWLATSQISTKGDRWKRVKQKQRVFYLLYQRINSIYHTCKLQREQASMQKRPTYSWEP